MTIKSAIAKGLCWARGTEQCAPICMSHSSLHTAGGDCPERDHIWRREVGYIADELKAEVDK